MTWVKIDDAMPEHQKVIGLSDAAFRVHISAICYVARNELDGLISAGAVRQFGWQRKVRELVEARLWDPTDDGFAIHDYLEYNPSRAQLIGEREIARRRAAMNADPDLARVIKHRDGDSCRYCGHRVNWRDRKSALGATYDHVVPISKGGSEHPDNLVVCCRECNSRKGGRTPDEAGMTLRPPRNLDGIQPDTGHPVPVPVPDPDPVPLVSLSVPPTPHRTGLTDEQEFLRVRLHGQARDKLLGGSSAPDLDWCEDLIRRGLTESDIDVGIQAALGKGLAYCRAVMLRRVEEREAGVDHDQLARDRAAVAARESHAGSSRARGVARNGTRTGSADEFGDLPPHAIRASDHGGDAAESAGARAPISLSERARTGGGAG